MKPWEVSHPPDLGHRQPWGQRGARGAKEQRSKRGWGVSEENGQCVWQRGKRRRSRPLGGGDLVYAYKRWAYDSCNGFTLGYCQSLKNGTSYIYSDMPRPSPSGLVAKKGSGGKTKSGLPWEKYIKKRCWKMREDEGMVRRNEFRNGGKDN